MVKRVLVVDGQGGGLGRAIIDNIKGNGIVITAVGANALATSNMLKAGADFSATGENAVVVNARHTDYIIGAVGIVIADALLGEITPTMATAIGASDAKRILIPVNRCNTMVVGVTDKPLSELLSEVVKELNKADLG
ncbi:MAG: DUF3842 family protein, partial [Clostridia bacterium]